MATWATLKADIEKELDLENEDFANEDELKMYANRGINTAENLLLTLNEDYLLAPAYDLTLVSGTSEYALPSGMYAQKIRRIYYINGSTKYKIRKIKNLDDTVDLESGDEYMHLVTNSSSSGFKINLYPTPEESGQYVKIWYLRNVNEVDDDADLIDLPEAYNYVKQFVKDQVTNKERMTPDAPPSAALKEEERLMIEALTDRFPDEDNIPEMDTSFYREVN